MPNVDKGCMTHMDGDDCCKFDYDMVVILKSDKERLNRIEAVWEKYQHQDKILMDNTLRNDDSYFHHILYDLWQAIRREE